MYMYVHCGNRSPIQSHDHVNVLSNQCTWQLCGCQAYVVLIMKYRQRSKVWHYRSIMLSCTQTITVGRVQSACVKFHVHWVSAPLARAGKFAYHNICASWYSRCIGNMRPIHLRVQRYNTIYITNYVEWRHQHFSRYSVSWSCKFVLLMDQK